MTVKRLLMVFIRKSVVIGSMEHNDKLVRSVKDHMHKVVDKDVEKIQKMNKALANGVTIKMS